MRVPGIIRWPGKVPADVVTSEILAAVDWLPALAGMAGASKLVPKDRPIDGVNASAFMLGKSNTTGRDSYMFFGIDGELLSIKWKIYKTIFRYTETPALEKPYIQPPTMAIPNCLATTTGVFCRLKAEGYKCVCHSV